MNENMSMRAWTMNDMDNLLKYANNPKIAQNMTAAFPHPFTNEAGERFIEMANSKIPIHIFAICINNEAIGGIGVQIQHDIHQKSAELGYWLAEPFWGKGIVSEAIVPFLDIK